MESANRGNITIDDFLQLFDFKFTPLEIDKIAKMVTERDFKFKTFL